MLIGAHHSYRRNRPRALFVYHFLKLKFRFKGKQGGGDCYIYWFTRLDNFTPRKWMDVLEIGQAENVVLVKI